MDYLLVLYKYGKVNETTRNLASYKGIFFNFLFDIQYLHWNLIIVNLYRVGFHSKKKNTSYQTIFLYPKLKFKTLFIKRKVISLIVPHLRIIPIKVLGDHMNQMVRKTLFGMNHLYLMCSLYFSQKLVARSVPVYNNSWYYIFNLMSLSIILFFMNEIFLVREPNT